MIRQVFRYLMLMAAGMVAMLLFVVALSGC